MLVELLNVKQEGGATRRRWFQADGMELILWFAGTGAPEGFQICYVVKDGKEHALTWRPERGFTHEEVKSGGTRPDKNMTPILVKDGSVPWAFVQGEFERRSTKLDPVVRDYVLGALRGGTG